jgi:hypothetical protein
MEELRAVPRRRMFNAGVIEFGSVGIECTVMNLSDTGAALQIVTSLYIPDRFTLSVPSEQFKRRCRVIWRKEKLIGVAFD